MSPTILVLVLAAGDPAPAGAAYTRGLDHYQARRMEEAAAAFEEAIRHESVESQALKYRNETGRHRHTYFPYFALARVRHEQALQETSPYTRREALQTALRHYAATSHPEGSARAGEVRSLLATLEKDIAEVEANAIPPELTALKAKVDRACEAADFEGAFADIRSNEALLARFPKAKAEILGSARSRQQAAIKNYDTLLGSRLDSIARTDPTYEADVVLPLLKPARVPVEVSKSPAARFGWLQDLCDVYERHLETVKTAMTADADQVIAAAAAFELLATKALEIDLMAGYRASRNMAHSLRMARLRELASSADRADSDLPGKPAFQSATSSLLRASEAAQAAAAAAVDARRKAFPAGAGELGKYLEGDLPYQQRQLDGQRGKVKEVTVAYERRQEAASRAGAAEAALLDPGMMSTPEGCRKTGQALTVFENQPWFETLPAPARARILFARAIAEASASFLEGEPAARVAERCRTDLIRSLGLDPSVQEQWSRAGRLSPRLSALFAQVRK